MFGLSTGRQEESGFTGFRNQKEQNDQKQQKGKQYLLFFIRPPFPHTPLCISGCSQSGMMARGPWINPRPDVYATPVCLIGSPPLTLLPPCSRHHPVIVNGNSLMWRRPSHCQWGLVIPPLRALQKWPRSYRGCCRPAKSRGIPWECAHLSGKRINTCPVASNNLNYISSAVPQNSNLVRWGSK